VKASKFILESTEKGTFLCSLIKSGCPKHVLFTIANARMQCTCMIIFLVNFPHYSKVENMSHLLLYTYRRYQQQEP